MGDNDSPAKNDTAKWGGKHHRTSSGKSGPNLALIGTGVVAALCIAFLLQNNHETSIHFVFFTKTTTTRWLIMTTLILGAVADRLFSSWWRRRRRKSVVVKN
ncbi:MAG: hypothetical protein WCK14_09605 [Actinomycetota bacterium]|jgi:hypothetical protein